MIIVDKTAADGLPALAAPAADPRNPWARLNALFDEGSFTATRAEEYSGMVAGTGRIEGLAVVAFCCDARIQGGALGVTGRATIVSAYDLAMRERIPIVGLWHSGGARLAEGVESLHAVGLVFAAMTRASGVVPQISVVLGPTAGGGAYGPALTDIVICAEQGRIFVTGPDVVRSVTGEDVDMATLGGPEPHSKRSGVVHVATKDEPDAIWRARQIAVLLGRQGLLRLSDVAEVDMSGMLPENERRAYDVRPLVRGVLDEPGVELHAKWAPNMVTTLGRLGGRTVGVIANNPLRRGGCLDATSAEKAARFVRMCDAFGVPMVVVVDVPGYLPGVGQEHEGVVRRGAKLLHAFAEATVPRVTLVTRKSYGGAFIAMNSHSLGATKVLAWPTAEVAVMGTVAAVRILHRRTLATLSADQRQKAEIELGADYARSVGGVERARELGVIDEIINPAETRHAIARAVGDAAPSRGAHGNIPL